MKWARETPHLLVSTEGYKIGRYRVAGVDYFRPSLLGSFICGPQTDLDAAKSECDKHFEVDAK